MAPDHPPRPASDRVATVFAALLAILAGAGSVMLSPFFVMATDACGADNCNLDRLTWAYVVTWGGVALAAVVAVAGVVRAARRGTAMWIWPVVGVPAGDVGVEFSRGGLNLWPVSSSYRQGWSQRPLKATSSSGLRLLGAASRSAISGSTPS
jgi:hypothetical protein